MNSHSGIVEGGGWLTRRIVGRPRARFFGFLSVVWLVVAVGASFPFWDGWPRSFGYRELFCGLLLLPLPIFVVLALVCLLTERQSIIIEQRRDPDYDARKLY